MMPVKEEEKEEHKVKDEDLLPLHLAAKRNDLDQLKDLLRKGDDFNVKGPYGRMPLHLAAEFGQIKCVQHLLAVDGIEVNARTEGGMTPVFMACLEGKIF